MTKKTTKTDSSELNKVKQAEPQLVDEVTEDEVQEVRESIVDATPRPQTPAFSTAPPPVAPTTLTDDTAKHKAVRHIANASAAVGKNVPVIAGYKPKRKIKPDPPTQLLKSIPGTRTGVFVPDKTRKPNK